MRGLPVQGIARGHSLSGRRLVVSYLSALALAIGFLLTMGYPGENDYNNYVVTSAALIVLSSILFSMPRYGITDSNLIFGIIFVATYIVVPLLYVTGYAWTTGISVIENNWNLLVRANMGSLLALIGYGYGVRVSKSRYQVASENLRELLTPERARMLIIPFLSMGIVSWVLIFVITGMPTRVFIGQPAAYRELSLMGGEILYDTIYASALACFMFIIARPKSSLLSPGNLAMMGLTLGILAIAGARLMLISVPVGAFFLSLLANHQHTGRGKRKGNLLKVLGLFAIAVAVILFSGMYRGYRTEGIEWVQFDVSALIDGFVSTFDTVAGYYIILAQVPEMQEYWYGMSYLYPFVAYIPRFIFPAKYDYTYTAVKFTELFFGYDVAYDPYETVHGASLLGETYLNLGWYGILPVMFGFGVLNNWLSMRAHDNRCTNMFRLIYALYLVVFLPYFVKGGLVSPALWFLQRVLVPIGVSIFVLEILGMLVKSGEPSCKLHEDSKPNTGNCESYS